MTAESVYATPMQPELENDRSDTPPPLPPPPFDFRFGAAASSASSEVIPIVTKVHHTYANVSEAVQGKSVESSFRPGETACLSSNGSHNVTDLARSLNTAAGDPNAAGNGLVEADCHTRLHSDDDRRSILTDPLPASANGNGSTEIDRRSSSSCHSVHSNASSSSLSSHSSVSVLPASTSSTSCSTATATHLLPSPPANGVGLARNLPLLPPSRAASQANGGLAVFSREGFSKNSDVNGSHHADAIAVRHWKSEVTDDRMPHQLTLQKADGKHTMVAPLKVVREHHPQMARIMKRSFSENVCAGNTNTLSVDGDSTASEDSDVVGFLHLAERARQEYIRRRASAGRDGQRPQSCLVEHSQSITEPPPFTAGRQRSPPVTGGEYESLIATGTSGLSVNRSRRAAAASHGNVRNSIANEQCLLQQFDDARMNQNRCGSETLLQQPGVVRRHTSIPASVLSGTTSVSSDYELPELEPHGDGPPMVILPPPPDFAESNNGGNLPSTDNLCSLDVLLPPPPPEFTDSPTHIGSGVNHTGSSLNHIGSGLSHTSSSPRYVESDFRRRPVSTWSVGDVTQWLDSIEMGCHRDSFVAHCVDGHRLVGLGRSELIGLGVSQVGQRMNLERAIKRAVISTPYCP